MTVGARRQGRDLGWPLVVALSLGPIVLWLTAIPLRVRFEDPAATLHSLANIAALVGTAGFAVNLLLGARLGFAERLFGGLDRLYGAHRLVGYGSLVLILFHALLLALSKAVESGAAPRSNSSSPAPGGSFSPG